jgi:hypothetical protein
MKQQHVDSFLCPFCIAEALEESVGGELVCLQAYTKETAEEGNP